ncbi:RNA polymerase sigma factor (sigma-70 family) [Mesonia hippocampi]|uniref:RNA polymerase sigma factor (Sigma-70 family) n=1 Tax=Mesonia hippocampi TaxID=1628250 RepID=A0A840EMP4_9FLAO|nr:sigma-70 family RNA polymerase sigma factor [Mesonia hippocampi]MBB4118375.1 RNA polymerase sigma factor (sigma-70 family) [Mesonia hippocampi]
MNKEKRLIAHIKSGNKTALGRVYTQYKKEFLLYSSRFSIPKEEVLDIYQDAIVALYENIVSGKLETLSCSVKTYLFAIGKYKIYNCLKVKMSPKDITDFEYLLKDENEENTELQEENIKKLRFFYKNLGGKCKEVLKMFYYENLSLEEIKQQLKYTSKDVVKSQKSRCLKQLREMMLKENK